MTKKIPTYRGVPTMKYRVIKFVAENGPQRYTDLIKFIWNENNPNDKLGPNDKLDWRRGYYAGAFSKNAPYTEPGRDGRYLYKDPENGLYYAKPENHG